jgi:hypothetical protein
VAEVLFRGGQGDLETVIRFDEILLGNEPVGGNVDPEQLAVGDELHAVGHAVDPEEEGLHVVDGAARGVGAVDQLEGGGVVLYFGQG